MNQSTIRDYKVEVATLKDADNILQLLRKVASWLHSKGEKQWETISTKEEDDEIREEIAKGNTYIILNENQLIATFNLLKSQSTWDIWLWGENSDEAVYLHKLAIHPTKIGGGFGSEVLKWIEDHLYKHGSKKLRLDCIANNKNLNTFYTKNNFIKIGVNHAFSLYEKDLSIQK
ncbi:GNAT family N-acetyltransferase [Oceanobacillus sp. CAU 1775]